MSMTLSFNQATALRNEGFGAAGFQILAYLGEHGFTEPGLLAKVCDVSIRKVYEALSVIKRCGIPVDAPRERPVVQNFAQNMLTEKHTENRNGAENRNLRTDSPYRDRPLWQALVAEDVWEGCANKVLRLVDAGQLTEEGVREQLRIHAWRKEQHANWNGNPNEFHFETHPGRYLYRACLNNWPAPEDFYVERQHVPAEEGVADPPLDVPAEMADNENIPTENLLPLPEVEAIKADLEASIAAHEPLVEAPPETAPMAKTPEQIRQERLQAVLQTIRFFREYFTARGRDWRTESAITTTLQSNGFTLKEVLPHV